MVHAMIGSLGGEQYKVGEPYPEWWDRVEFKGMTFTLNLKVRLPSLSTTGTDSR